jgi:fibronectin-binding autotransporter adhesin
MKKPGLIFKILVTAVVFNFVTVYLWSQTTFSGTGNWSTPARWSAGVPVAGTAAIIADGAVCTVDGTGATCASLTFATNGTNSSVTVTNDLTVSGAIAYSNPSSNNRNQTIAVGSGTLSCSSISMVNTTANTRVNNLTVSTGSISVSGNITCAGDNANKNTITFSGGGTLNIGGNFTITTLTFTPGTGTVNYNATGAQIVGVLTYSNLTLSGTGAKTFAAGTTTVNSVLSMEGTATATVTGTLTYGAASTLQYMGSGVQTTGAEFPATFGGTGGVIINNSNGVSLNSSRTVSYRLSMTSGTLNMANTNLTTGSLTGSGNLTHSTGTAGARTLTIGSDNSSPPAYTGIISNGTATSVAIIKSGTGIITLSGANTYTGPTTVNGGTLKAGIAAQAFGVTSAMTLANTAGVVLDITGFNNTIGSLTGGGATGGNVTLGAATLTIGSDNTSPSAFAGIIGGIGAIAKTGTGTLILSGANTFSGTTTVNVGIIRLGASGGATNTPLGTTGAGTTVSTGAALDLNGFTLGTAEALTLNGTGISSGGALINSSATAVNYNGVITLGSASGIGTTGNITLGGSITGGQDLTKIGSATLNLGTGTVTLNGLTISAGTLTSTTGTLNIAGDFINSGTFTHNNGTVNLTEPWHKL